MHTPTAVTTNILKANFSSVRIAREYSSHLQYFTVIDITIWSLISLEGHFTKKRQSVNNV